MYHRFQFGVYLGMKEIILYFFNSIEVKFNFLFYWFYPSNHTDTSGRPFPSEYPPQRLGNRILAIEIDAWKGFRLGFIAFSTGWQIKCILISGM